MEYSEFLRLWDDDDLTHLNVSTSGSTGKPKTIRLPKTLMKESALRTIRFFNLNDASRLHSCISPDYIGGKMMAVRARCCHAHFSWESPSNRPTLGTNTLNVQPSRYDLVSVVPSQMWHILNIPGASQSRYLVGGSAIPESLRHEIIRKGFDCWESYGMTETSSHIAVRKIDRISSPFHPLPGIRISKSSNDTLVISLGYDYEDIMTNDIVNIHPSGDFEILGRLDNVIVSGGLKVFPEETERILAPFLTEHSIETFLITSEKDDKWGERILLLIEQNDEISNQSDFAPIFEKILQRAKQSTDSFRLPKSFRIIDHLPRTQNGKLKRTHNP